MLKSNAEILTAEVYECDCMRTNMFLSCGNEKFPKTRWRQKLIHHVCKLQQKQNGLKFRELWADEDAASWKSERIGMIVCAIVIFVCWLSVFYFWARREQFSF